MRIIAGPCQHESYEHSLKIAKECKRVCDKYGIEYYFKASFDKANRTSINSKRGSENNPLMSMQRFLSDAKKMKTEISGLKVLTDIHERHQIGLMEKVVDVIQIPAFLCRQTDLIQAVCKSRTIEAVNIKKGQFLAPWDVKGILSKCSEAKEVWITERGTSFGYNRLVVDFTGVAYMLDTFDCSIVLDATHSVQAPGGNGMASGGNRDYVPSLCRAGSAVGVDNFFLEVHDDPDNAPSDGANMLNLKDFDKTIEEIVQYNYER